MQAERILWVEFLLFSFVYLFDFYFPISQSKSTFVVIVVNLDFRDIAHKSFSSVLQATSTASEYMCLVEIPLFLKP